MRLISLRISDLFVCSKAKKFVAEASQSQGLTTLRARIGDRGFLTGQPMQMGTTLQCYRKYTNKCLINLLNSTWRVLFLQSNYWKIVFRYYLNVLFIYAFINVLIHSHLGQYSNTMLNWRNVILPLLGLIAMQAQALYYVSSVSLSHT